MCPKLTDARKGQVLRLIYDRLLAVYGPQSWWPAETSFEVCVGAILTQNTNWKNVERAIEGLRAASLLSYEGLRACSVQHLAPILRPAGYFNIKAKRLKNFVDFLTREHGGSLKRLGYLPWPVARMQLLAVNGIGQETADSILLYALGKPVFVIDAYAKRMLARHGFPEGDGDYACMQELFMTHLAPDPGQYNEYHALIVRLGKDFRGPQADLSGYPLEEKKYFV